jgi:ankyrin repeat protein
MSMHSICNIRYITAIIISLLALLVAPKKGVSTDLLNKRFLLAVGERDFASMEYLLKQGADINTTFKDSTSTALTAAASSGDIELAKFLLEKGANPAGSANFPNSPIYFAIAENQTAIVEALLDAGVDQNYAWSGESGGTLLISAVQFGHFAVVKLLIDRGANINSVGNGKYSPLYRSIIYDRFAIFCLLLEHCARLNADDIKALDKLEWEKDEHDKEYVKMIRNAKDCVGTKLKAVKPLEMQRNRPVKDEKGP